MFLFCTIHNGVEISGRKVPKFRPHSTIGTKKNLVGLENQGMNFCQIYTRGGIFEVAFFINHLDILPKKLYISTDLLNFSVSFWKTGSLKKKHSKIGLYESMLCADRIFSPAAEFFG
jgi:hypothetical protein